MITPPFFSKQGIGMLLPGVLLVCLVSCGADSSQRSSKEQTWQHRLSYLQNEVEDGNPKAELWLAWANAVGKTPVPKKKFEWMELPEAHHPYWTAASKLVASGQFEGDPKKAWKLLEAAMDAGEPQAIAMFANLLATGQIHHLRTPKDSREALFVALQSAEKGNLYGMQIAAWLYAFGSQSLQDHRKAAKLAIRASDSGYIPAKVLLGWMYASGIGVKADSGKARHIAEVCAKSGHPYALNFLTYTYQFGIGGPRKLKEAFAIADSLAKQGSAAGMLNLGNAYFYGWGVAQDKAVGVEWWKRAGAAGASAGYQAAGNAYLMGNGVPRSRSRAWLMFTLKQGQSADQVAIKVWADRYREARLLNTRQWLRNLRTVRVSARSMTEKRSNQQMQRIAEIGVRHYGLKHPLKVDPDADVELRIHLGSFANNGSRHNMAVAFAEFHTYAPVLMRGEFINTDVVIQYGISVQPIASDLFWVNLDGQLSKAVFESLKAAMNPSPDHSVSDKMLDQRFKKELWPPEQDHKMYIKYQVARSFGNEPGGSPLSGFSTISAPEIRIVGGENVREWKLESEWKTQLDRYGIGFDEDSPNFITFDAIVENMQWFKRGWNVVSYASFQRRNVMLPLPDGRLARETAGLLTSPYASTLDNVNEAEDQIITNIQKICETVGPGIQTGIKTPLTPQILVPGTK